MKPSFSLSELSIYRNTMPLLQLQCIYCNLKPWTCFSYFICLHIEVDSSDNTNLLFITTSLILSHINTTLYSSETIFFRLLLVKFLQSIDNCEISTTNSRRSMMQSSMIWAGRDNISLPNYNRLALDRW